MSRPGVIKRGDIVILENSLTRWYKTYYIVEESVNHRLKCRRCTIDNNSTYLYILSEIDVILQKRCSIEEKEYIISQLNKHRETIENDNAFRICLRITEENKGLIENANDYKILAIRNRQTKIYTLYEILKTPKLISKDGNKTHKDIISTSKIELVLGRKFATLCSKGN